MFGYGFRSAAFSTVLLVTLATFPPGKPAQAAGPVVVPAGAITNVSALGITAGATPVYLATPQGLFRSTDATLREWEQMNSIPTIGSISPNPLAPDDLVYATNKGVFRSIDGGRTAQQSGCALGAITRAPSSPTILYAAGSAGTSCAPPAGDQVGAILQSTDDGRTWTTAYQPPGPYNAGLEYGPIAIDPMNPSHVVAGWIYSLHPSAGTIAIGGTGQPWGAGQLLPLPYGDASAVAFDPIRPHNLWVAWNSGCAGELDHNGQATVPALLSSRSPNALAFDPVSGRLYLATAQGCGPNRPSRIYMVDSRANTYLPVANVLSATSNVYTYLAVTRSGYLLAGGSAVPLVVLKLNAPGVWQRASFLAVSARLLGSPISPPTTCHGMPCQYFEKGALAAPATPLPLVADLFTAAARLPVGGDTSTVTYGSLATLTRQRMSPPPGFQHGVLVGKTGTFVPISAHLSPAPGYIVPPFFWRFLTDPRQVPGGWLHDVGLPLTPAVLAVVTKGALGQRRITVQAFQLAVLTYDPRNPAATQVERANIGSDYATAFPMATR